MCEDKINVRVKGELPRTAEAEREKEKESRSHAQLLLSLQCCRVAKSHTARENDRERECEMPMHCRAPTTKTCRLSLWLPLHGACDVIGQKVRHI